MAGFTFVPGKGLKDTVFNPNASACDMSKLDTIEKIRDYLEGELGIETFMRVYPIIKEFGDDILFMDKIGELRDSLAHLISGETLDRLHIQFSTLVFYELEMEKNESQGLEKDYKSIQAAVNVFKDCGMTATFGKFGSR